MASTVQDNPDESRYEIAVDGEVAGVAVYRRAEDRVVFTHTEVDDGHEGEGLGSQLVKAALDDVRAAGRQIVPACPFVSAYIERHAEYADLVDREMTSRLVL